VEFVGMSEVAAERQVFNFELVQETKLRFLQDLVQGEDEHLLACIQYQQLFSTFAFANSERRVVTPL